MQFSFKLIVTVTASSGMFTMRLYTMHAFCEILLCTKPVKTMKLKCSLVTYVLLMTRLIRQKPD